MTSCIVLLYCWKISRCVNRPPPLQMRKRTSDELVGHSLHHPTMTVPPIPNNTDSALFFYTPPTSPPPSTPDLFFTPPSSPYHDTPSSPDSSDYFLASDDYDGLFPIPSDAAIDLALDEEGLTTLEKVYLYSRSKAYHHRIFIVHELHQCLDHISPQEAVEYVLPLLSGLAMDKGAPCPIMSSKSPPNASYRRCCKRGSGC